MKRFWNPQSVSHILLTNANITEFVYYALDLHQTQRIVILTASAFQIQLA